MGKEGRRLDMGAVWLTSDCNNSMAFSGQGVMCIDAQRWLINQFQPSSFLPMVPVMGACDWLTNS